MEDYIFLIIAVALSIFGAFNKKKKQDIPPVPESKEEMSAKHPFDFDFFGFPDESEEAEVVTAPKAKVAPKKNVDVEAKPFVPEAFKSRLPPRPKSTMQISVPKNQLKPDVDNSRSSDLTAVQAAESGEEGYLEGFSLRKAFVYSEILNRKY